MMKGSFKLARVCLSGPRGVHANQKAGIARRFLGRRHLACRVKKARWYCHSTLEADAPKGGTCLAVDHQGFVDRHGLLACHRQLATEQVAEVVLSASRVRVSGKGTLSTRTLALTRFGVVDEPQIRHLSFQQFAVGLVIAAEVGRLEGGIGWPLSTKPAR